MTDVVVLNGGSSSGKSTIARALQAQLPIPFLTFSVDDLIQAMPRAMSEEDPAGIVISSDGGVVPGRSSAGSRSLGIVAWPPSPGRGPG